MKHYAIVLRHNATSERSLVALRSSTEVPIERFDAVTPDRVIGLMDKYYLNWNYPWEGEHLDLQTGLVKSAYRTKEPQKRIACALSHYLLWCKCLEEDEPIVILEHDALFTKDIDFDIMTLKFNIIGINDPRGATRLSQIYHQSVKMQPHDFELSPYIDDQQIPQGLAGNSAYVISPNGAASMIQAAKHYGLWPNDALMCRQLIPRLGVSKQYYTKVQGRPSTTTG